METLMLPWNVLSVALLIGTVLCNPLTSNNNAEVTYDELRTLGASCYPSDSCQRNETLVGSKPYNCDCDSSCAVYDTCCVDSEFKIHKDSPKPKSNPKCLSVYNSHEFDVFMVDSCKGDDTFDSLCFSNPEESNDPFLMVPVTSNLTGITYKNYFCAVCNEEVDSTRLIFWDMQIWGNDTLLKNLSEPRLKFNKTMESWTVLDGKSNGTSAGVTVELNIQRSSQAEVKYCSFGLVESCPIDWTDEAVAIKCRDYMAVVNFDHTVTVRYRNPHCALCNSENLGNLQCFYSGVLGVPAVVSLDPKKSFAPAGRPSVGTDIPLLSLFVLEDRKKKCGRNMVYDKFADKCRCNSRISAKENGKCVHKV